MKKINKKDRLDNTKISLEIVSKLTLEEKVNFMTGIRFDQIDMEKMGEAMKAGHIHYNEEPYPAGGSEKYKVPPLLFCDGPRGVVCGRNQTTCFPVPMLRGATFNTSIEEKIGTAIGKEIRAFGGNYFGGVCINLPYNPGWGRSQESYGEESFALGKFGSALVRGVQDQSVIACVKHFAFNSMENSRFKISIECDRRTEREVFLPHFKDCVDAGAASIMCSYNYYQGVPVSSSDYLQRKILKEEWDFDGFIISDFVQCVRDTVNGVIGGTDIEMPIEMFYGKKLVDAVNEGLVPMKYIDDSCLRIIRTMITFDKSYDKEVGKEVLACKEHDQLALLTAQEGITLLKNNKNLLPLNKNKQEKILVLGKLANKANTGDNGSSRVYKEDVVTPLMGFKEIAPNITFDYNEGNNIEELEKIVNNYDKIIFCVGFDSSDEGEYIEGWEEHPIGGDRKFGLRLHENEVSLIKKVSKFNKNTIVVLNGGNTIIMSEWVDEVSSVIMAYYSGQQGGTALAQIIFGDINPSGKLPYVLPYDEKDLPQVNWDTTHQFYEYYHGYARLEKNKVKPQLPYGFGLSYTAFKFSNLKVSSDSKNLNVQVLIENIGKVAGAEVAQLYVGFKNSSVDRPVRLLRGFEKVHLNPNEKVEVKISTPLDKLEWYNPETSKFEFENMEYQIFVGNCLDDNKLLSTSINLKK